jgi:LTXXQ motif family protein
VRSIFRLTIGALAAVPVSIGAQQPATTTSRQPVNIVTRIIRGSMRGIALTETEKTSLRAVQETHRPQFQTLAAEMKPIRLALRDARQKHDTATARAARKALAGKRRAAVGVLQQSLRDIRAKLSPEHQTQFDTNLVRVRVLIRRWALGVAH